MTENGNKLVQKWEESKKALDTAKRVESSLRDRVCNSLFIGNVGAGTRRVSLGQHFDLVQTITANYKIDGEAFKAVKEDLDPKLCDLVVNWQPKLDKKIYDKLSLKDQSKMAECLTLTYGKPQLKIVQKKGK